MKTDNELLESYARHGSEPAFRELVERRINLVHSAALRESKGNVSQAEDITQAVFAELARRASSLVRHPALAGWLYTTVRRMAANVRRAESRRQLREQEVFAMNELLSPDPNDKLWQQLRPVLDDVMHELNEDDRTAVVLRFFEGRSLKDVGLALGLNENAARMRVERSLEKLRRFLSQRGVKSTAGSLAAVLALGAVSGASSALAATVATDALTSTASASSAAFLSVAKIKIAAAGMALVLAAGFVIWHQIRSNRSDVERAQPAVVIQQLSATAASNAPDNAAIPTPAPTNTAASQMALRVVEAETGAPLAHAKILLAYFRPDGASKDFKRSTDANGNLGVDTPQLPFNALNLFVTADGHAPKVVSWSFARALPEEYTLKLPRGAIIAGVVTDEAGKAIAGAKIEFDIPAGNDPSLQENFQFGPDTATRTDTNGHWSCNMVPKFLDRVALRITSTNYSETEASVRLDAPDANNSVMTMASGFTVSGAVTDLNGLAIRNAKIRQVRLNSEGEAVETTDALGNFAFKNMKAGPLMLAVQAQGFAPAVQTLQVTGMVTALQFQLGPGFLLRGHIVDENGRPIPHARAETQHDTMAIRKIAWSARTGANGRFEWDSAPQEPLRYSFSAGGFVSSYTTLPADGTDNEIKLTHMQPGKDIIQITGTAVDADTGQPLDAFTVKFRRIEPDWVVPFEFGTAGKDGKFILSLNPRALPNIYQLQLEKEGYLPAVSTNLMVKDGNQTLAFKLQKGSGPSGIVLLPGGEPAANAAVYLCTPQSGVKMDGPCHVVERGLNTTTYFAQTDETGRFFLPAASAPEGVIVIHDQGFAQLSMAAAAAASNITLQAWGRIEGSLVLDSQPVANETIYAGHQVTHYDEQGRRFGFMTYGFKTTTDSSGKFSFEKVPPGACEVLRQNGGQDHITRVVINPGSTAEVVLGGTGRPVVGNAVLPGATGAINWPNATVTLNSKTDSDPGPRPNRDHFPSTAAFIQATENWRSALDAQRRFSTICGANGSFRLQDIPSGTYELKLSLRDPKLDSVSPTPNMGVPPEIAAIVREVTVPEISGGASEEPLDLGTLELVPRRDSASAQ